MASSLSARPEGSQVSMTTPVSLRAPTTPASTRSPLPATRIWSPRQVSTDGAASPVVSKRTSVQDFSGAKGAEGGTGAIGVRRRESNSFKTMSTGSLVSNSPFTKRLGAVGSPQTSHADISNGSVTRNLYGASRIPTPTSGAFAPTRKTSGGRKASGEQEGPVKENSMPRSDSGELQDLANVAFSAQKQDSSARPRSTSPSLPFKPVRHQAPSSNFDSTSFMKSAGGGFMPSRATAMSKTRDETTRILADSPPLMQAPYEIAPLSLESVPNDLWRYRDDAGSSHAPPMSPKMMNAGFQLGVRPGGAPASGPTERRIAGASVPPPNTPPHQRTASISGSPSPSSALSPTRRGIRGPRAITPGTDGDETETEDLGKTLRRQPSGKTVTWAATEEVLEFEVDDRRASGVSTSSTVSDDNGRYWGGQGEGDSYEEDSVEEGNSSMGFAEGGSIEVHDVESSEDEGDDDDAESAISSASTVEDIVGAIDDFILEESYEDIDVFSPSQLDRNFELSPDQPVYPHHSPSSAFSDSSASHVASSQDRDDATSLSSYTDDDSEIGKVTRGQILERARATMPAPLSPQIHSLPPPPSIPSAALGQPINLSAFPPSKATAAAASQTSTSTPFSLPEVPGISPFLGFEDDGAASSVVTLDMERPAVLTTQPLTPQRTPSQSTPTSTRTITAASGIRTPAMQPSDSPILSAFSQGTAQLSPGAQQSPQLLSRHGSIVQSETGSLVNSDVGSWFGSMSSGGSPGKVFMSRDRLQQKMREHQDLLTGSRSSMASNTNGASAFPASPAGPGRFPVIVNAASAPTSSSSNTREIQARPAPKARSATLSTGMLPTIVSHPHDGVRLEVGAPLTSELAHEMASPLDRLQRGAGEKSHGSEWRSGDSLIGIADAARAPDDDEVGAEDTSVELNASLGADKPRRGGKGGRRRSSSTSDAAIAETSSASMQEPVKLPRHGFSHHLDSALPGTGAGFASGLESSLDDIFNSRNRTYRMHERRAVVYAADVSSAVKGAGDVDPGRAWRKKRPSNMHEVNRSLSVMSMTTAGTKKSKALSGQLFVQLKEATLESCPLPRERSSVTFSLDNGRQRVEAGVRVLDTKILIRNEFDLVCSDSLAFTIDLHVPPQAAPPVPKNLSLPPPPSPTKTSRGLRSLLSSPKKKKEVVPVRPAQAMTPDPFYDFVSPDGKLASAHFVFADEASKCRLTKHRFAIPFENKSARRSVRGTMTIDMLYVPTIPGLSRDNLPKSMDEALQGMELAEHSANVSHEGVLTQLGGDCTVWRRRNFKLRGNRLVPYSEVTKQSHVEIDLALVTAVEDLNAPHAKSDSDEELGAMDNSFRLVFRNGSTIDFYADTNDAASKMKWIDLLQKQVGSGQAQRPAAPVWAQTMRRLVAAGKI